MDEKPTTPGTKTPYRIRKQVIRDAFPIVEDFSQRNDAITFIVNGKVYRWSCTGYDQASALATLFQYREENLSET